MASLNKKDIKNALIIATFLIFFAILSTLAPWNQNENRSGNGILPSSILLLIIIIMWARYFYQKKIDLNSKNQEKTGIQIATEASTAIGGGINKIQSIGGFLISLPILVIGVLIIFNQKILFTVFPEHRIIVGVLMILTSIGIFFLSKFLWSMGSIKVKGRIYEKENIQQPIKPLNKNININNS